MASHLRIADAPPSAPFPRAVRTYVGRTGELDRVLHWLDRETLFLVYGIGGIGKSEFVYKVIEEARARERWRGVDPVLVEVRPGMPVEHILARIRVETRGPRSRLDIQSASTAHFEDDLAECARSLDAEPTLVFLDDLHHADAARAAHMLGYLSRHVRESRIFVASRVEIPLPPGTPTPVVTRLSTLGAGDTAAMVEQLATRLGIPVPDAERVFERSGGSPFFVQRELAGEEAAEESSLDRSLAELDPELASMLLLCSVLRGRFGGEEIATASAAAGDEDGDAAAVRAAVRELERRFLIDTGRGVVLVHDLVRDALARRSGDLALSAAHERAAAISLERAAADAGGGALDLVEAVHHLVRAGDYEGAWARVVASQRAVAAAGLDHLLLDDLGALHRELPGQRRDIDLVRARILVRRSLVAEADALLDEVRERGEEESLHYLLLAGEVAQRLGKLERSEDYFRRASLRAETRTERLQTALQLADVRSLRGASEEARAVLFAAETQLQPATAAERGRWGWSEALSYIMEERYGAGAEAAREAAGALAAEHEDDLAVLLGMLEILARVRIDDCAGARAVLDETLAAAAAAGALRENVLSLYTGVVAWGEGDLRAARVALDASHSYLLEHSDHVMASIAAYYLGQTQLGQGDVDGALDTFARMGDVAAAAELVTLAPRAVAAHAEAQLAAGRVDEAAQRAAAALEMPGIRGDGRWVAMSVLARAAATRGDLEEARRLHRGACAVVPDDAGDTYARSGDLERAAIELMGGDPTAAVDAANRAQKHYHATGRRFLEARSCIALAAALVARGGEADLVAAEVPLQRAEELAGAGDYPRVRSRAALVRAALVRKRGDGARARETLIAAVRTLDAQSDRPDHVALRAALQRADEADLASGVRATVGLLGLSSGPRYRIVDRDGQRTAAEHDVAAARASYELVVEPARAVITVERGERADKGRPMSCELLARLIESRGAVVPAEELFRDVWGGREYHPLRHRNTVYVAVRRLRQTLRKLLGDREVVETASGGWRIADAIAVAVIRPAE